MTTTTECFQLFVRNLWSKVRIIFQQKLWYLYDSMMTCELVTYFSQSLLSITVVIPEDLKEGADNVKMGLSGSSKENFLV